MLDPRALGALPDEYVAIYEQRRVQISTGSRIFPGGAAGAGAYVAVRLDLVRRLVPEPENVR